MSLASSCTHQLGNPKREIERLPRVQPRVAERLVAVVEFLFEDGFGASDALGHVLTSELEMHPPGQVPTSRCAAKKPCNSVMIASK